VLRAVGTEAAASKGTCSKGHSSTTVQTGAGTGGMVQMGGIETQMEGETAQMGGKLEMELRMEATLVAEKESPSMDPAH